MVNSAHKPSKTRYVIALCLSHVLRNPSLSHVKKKKQQKLHCYDISKRIYKVYATVVHASAHVGKTLSTSSHRSRSSEHDRTSEFNIGEFLFPRLQKTRCAKAKRLLHSSLLEIPFPAEADVKVARYFTQAYDSFPVLLFLPLFVP